MKFIASIFLAKKIRYVPTDTLTQGRHTWQTSAHSLYVSPHTRDDGVRVGTYPLSQHLKS